MAHPCTIQKSKFFYPIGHRAAVCLTESLSLEQSANILLLNCGDPRYVVWARAIADSETVLIFTKGISSSHSIWTAEGRSTSLAVRLSLPCWVRLFVDTIRPVILLTSPSTTARNILLFACFTDGKKKVNSEKIFQIFYHFYIDQESLDRLHAQCRKLVEVAVDIDS